MTVFETIVILLCQVELPSVPTEEPIKTEDQLPDVPQKEPGKFVIFYVLLKSQNRLHYQKYSMLLFLFGFQKSFDRYAILRKIIYFEAHSLFCATSVDYISSSNLRLLLLLLSLQLGDLCPCASTQGLIRPSPPRSRCDQSDHYFRNMVNPRAYFNV